MLRSHFPTHSAKAKVVNESGGSYEKTRVVMTVGVAFGSDVDQVREVFLVAALSVEFVVHVARPAPPPHTRQRLPD
ncbi:MAG: hypothetical protein JRC77_01440, partial [Deltaproteobacteria bacterium]|nr:hypothetical protein [Deltaproteobacteria bacterium]